jgi:hypothetical protein
LYDIAVILRRKIVSKKWVSLGEIYVNPDGSNMHPHAEYPIVGYEVDIEHDGAVVHHVTFQKQVRGEEVFMDGKMRCIRSVTRIVDETVQTRNSPTDRWRLFGGKLVEFRPHGPSLLDMAEYDIYFEHPSPERMTAIRAALGSISHSVTDTYRPIVDGNGNFTVNPVPVPVAKTS